VATAAKKRDDEDLEDRDEGATVQGGEDTHGVTVDLADLDAGEEGERRAKSGGDADLDIDARSALESMGDENEEVRKRRREEKRRKREEARAREEEKDRRIDALQEQVRALAQANAGREQQDIRSIYENLEGEQRTLVRQYEEAKALKEKAFKENDAKGIVDADEIIASARERYALLENQKARIVHAVRSERAQQQQQQQPRVSAELAKNARAFLDDHDWYDQAGGDRDSARVLAIDKKLYAEGWDPNTAGYWEELRERVREALPHRFDDGGRPQRRSITAGGSRESAGGAGQIHLPAEYVRSLKEAGMWDDPKVRAKMIRRYAEGRKKLEAR
jgi:hypothetical protein